MIIKRWTGTAFEALYPKTVAQQVFDASATNAVFDSNNKIKPEYLPDSVFDNLFFFDTLPNPANLTELGFLSLLSYAPTLGRSAKGFYFVASEETTLTTGPILDGGVHYNSIVNPSEEGLTSTAPTNLVLEPGDWVVLIDTGNPSLGGSAIQPRVFRWAVVNNTYELMTGATASVNGRPGLVPQPLIANQLQFLRGDGTWQAANNYVHPTQTAITANATDNGVNVIDSVTVNTAGHVTAVGTRDLSVATTSAAGVMSAADKTKLDGIATSANNYVHPTQTAIDVNAADNGVAVIDRVQVNAAGHVTAVSTRNLSAATTSAPGHMSAADKTKLDGIASGAQVNVGTNLAQGTRTTIAVPVTSSTGSSATLEAATTSLAGVMTASDKTKLDGIATGATANTGTVTSITVSAGSGLSGGGTVTTSGTITLTNALPNATHTGDVTGSGALTIANDAVSNAKLANMPAYRIKGNWGSTTTDPADLTGEQVRNITGTLPIFITDLQNAPTALFDNSALPVNTLFFEIEQQQGQGGAD
jgi:hypothetical protein